MTKLSWNIKTQSPNPVCGYKWAWSTVNLMGGDTASCHRVDPDKFTAETFADFHNTPKKILARQKMQQGKWPGAGCEYCRDIEASGGISDRLDFNSDESNLRYIPPEYQTQDAPVNVSPTILEMYFSNLCNLGCVYCSPVYSSVLEQEARRFPDVQWPVSDKVTKDTYQERLTAFWDWFSKNAHSLKRYHILGGEPFFQPELQQNLDFFKTHDLPDLQVVIFSNLKVNENRMTKYLSEFQNLIDLKKIKSLRIVCSLDCWGPQQEYIRTGLNMIQWEKNFTNILHNYSDIELEIHTTMTNLSIGTMPELVKKWSIWNHIRDIDLTHNFCMNPDYMYAGIFPRGYFSQHFEKMYPYLDDEDLEILKGMERTIDAMPMRNDLIVKLKEQLQGFDDRRKTNHLELFPWLTEYCKNIKEQ